MEPNEVTPLFTQFPLQSFQSLLLKHGEFTNYEFLPISVWQIAWSATDFRLTKGCQIGCGRNGKACAWHLGPSI